MHWGMRTTGLIKFLECNKNFTCRNLHRIFEVSICLVLQYFAGCGASLSCSFSSRWVDLLKIWLLGFSRRCVNLVCFVCVSRYLAILWLCCFFSGSYSPARSRGANCSTNSRLRTGKFAMFTGWHSCGSAGSKFETKVFHPTWQMIQM